MVPAQPSSPDSAHAAKLAPRRSVLTRGLPSQLQKMPSSNGATAYAMIGVVLRRAAAPVHLVNDGSGDEIEVDGVTTVVEGRRIYAAREKSIAIAIIVYLCDIVVRKDISSVLIAARAVYFRTERTVDDPIKSEPVVRSVYDRQSIEGIGLEIVVLNGVVAGGRARAAAPGEMDGTVSPSVFESIASCEQVTPTIYHHHIVGLITVE